MPTQRINTRNIRQNKRTLPKIMVFYTVEMYKIVNKNRRDMLFLAVFAKLRKATISFVMSVHPAVCLSFRPHGKTLLPPEKCQGNLTFKLFWKSSWESSSLIKIRLYMKVFSHLWQHLAEFFLQWEIFQIKIIEKIETHISSRTTFSENRAVYEIMSKNMIES